ncbi:MAG: PH domain-containing protein [Candidatus Shapirobacteria bacterium]|nr:PH domain-containing protein [Candidatus Shapirobacteria bacterium]
MYNSSNLPLSFKKVWKKTINRCGFLLSSGLTAFIFLSVWRKTANSDSIPSLINYYDIVLNYFIFGLLFFSIIYFVVIFIYEYLYYKSYYYNFEEDRAEITKGVISRSTGNIRYDRLQNIYVDQDFWDRIFGLYDVHYETAGETSGFYSHIDGLSKESADKLVAFLVGKSNRDNQPNQSFNSRIIQPNTSQQISENILNNNISNEEISSNIYKLSPAIIWINALSTTGFGLLVTFYLVMQFGITLFIYEHSNILNIILLYLALIVVIFLASYIHAFIWYKNFFFNFSKDKGEIRTGVISRSVSFLYYNKIQNINIRQGIIGRLLDIYNISIETAGESSGSRLNLPGFSRQDAQSIKNFLLEKSGMVTPPPTSARYNVS